MKRNNNFRIIKPGRIAASLAISLGLVSTSLITGCAGFGLGATSTTTPATLTGGTAIATGGSKVLATTGKVLGGIVSVATTAAKVAPVLVSLGDSFLGDLQSLTGNTSALVLAPVAAPALPPGAPVATP
jgi:phage-related tail protein